MFSPTPALRRFLSPRVDDDVDDDDEEDDDGPVEDPVLVPHISSVTGVVIWDAQPSLFSDTHTHT
jgi:hypothetical protein